MNTRRLFLQVLAAIPIVGLPASRALSRKPARDRADWAGGYMLLDKVAIGQGRGSFYGVGLVGRPFNFSDTLCVQAGGRAYRIHGITRMRVTVDGFYDIDYNWVRPMKM